MKHLLTIIFLIALNLNSQVIITEHAEDSQSLVITKMDFKVNAIGFLAETEVTMTFANPNNQDMIGNFYLPIPENSLVTGYALDVRSVLIDAVAIEKVKARQVFEAITRRRVDPGLLEWSKGNNFKTRVYPIPGRGTRTIRVKIVSELKHSKEGFLYTFPLKFKDPTNILTLRVNAASDDKPLIKTEAFKDIEFTKNEAGLYGGISKKFKTSLDSLEILFPDKKKEWQFVHEGKDEKLYYVWGKEVNALSLKRKVGKFITLFWDASHSRNSSNKAKELQVLEKILKKLEKGSIINLVVFRESLEPVKSFQVETQSDDLLKYLSSLVYDGGTLIDPAVMKEESKAANEVILFSDGLTTLNNSEGSRIHDKLTIFNSSNNLDRLYFDRLLSRNNGRFINLNNMKIDNAVNRFFSKGIHFDSRGKNYIDHFPRNNQEVSDIFIRTGVLDKNENMDSFTVFFKNGVEDSLKYSITRNDRKGGKLVESFYAVKKLETLLVEGNEDRILEHGLKYHMSTPHTSLLVLESYWDYVRYNIEPPESMPKWREDFLSRAPVQDTDSGPSEKYIKSLTVRKWNSFLNWWKTDFKYPPNFVWQKAIYFFPDDIEAGLLEIVQTKTAEGLGDLDGGIGDAGSGSGGLDGLGEPGTFGPEDPFGDPSDLGGIEDEKEVGDIETVKVFKEEWVEDSKVTEALKSSKTPFETYIELKKKFSHMPDFYMNSARFFYSKKLTKTGNQIASNSVEIMSGNVSYLRKLAFLYSEQKQFDLAVNLYQMIREERPDEPQSWRDLAITYAELGSYKKALSILQESLDQEFPRFAIKDILILDMNRILALAASKGIKLSAHIPHEFIYEVQMDLRVVVTWNADNYDIDLSVTEPSGEFVGSQNYISTIGGKKTSEMESYGPEQYVLKKAQKGRYKINVFKREDRTQEVVGEVMCRVDIYTDFGRKSEQVSSHYFVFNKSKNSHELELELGLKEGPVLAGKLPGHIILSPFDSQLSIAAKMKSFGFNWNQVKSANPNINWDNLQSGLKIKVPLKN
ncbi:MAG: hypothetical protein NE328_18905 [Lentisphaeraceae bacterium]|nr:hypothetical protein [Lentisphaeraceae bacterium]